MPEVLPLILPTDGREPARLTSADALQGTAGWLDIIGLQSGTGILSGLLGVDSTVAGSDFVWDDRYLPKGRSLYLEIYGSGSVLTTQMTAMLYTAAGVAVTSAAATITGTANALVRGTAFATPAANPLVNGVTYQLHFKTAVLGTGSLKLARLIIL